MSQKHVSLRQLELLIEYMAKHKDLALGRVRSKEGRALSSKLWKELASVLNSQTIDGHRSPKEWNKFYNDYKCRVKNKSRRITQSQQKTGGGPIDVPQLSVLEERLCAIIGPDKFVDLPVRQNPLQDYSETGVETEQSPSPPNVECDLDSMEFYQVETRAQIHDVEQQSRPVSTSNSQNIEQQSTSVSTSNSQNIEQQSTSISKNNSRDNIEHQSTSTVISKNSRSLEPNNNAVTIQCSNSQDIDQPSTSKGSSSKHQKQNSKGDIINEVEKTKNILASIEKAKLEINEAQVKAMLERNKIEMKKVEEIHSLASAAWALINILKQDSCEVRQNIKKSTRIPSNSSEDEA